MGWRRYVSRTAADRRRAEELDAHVQLLVDDHIARGATRDDARRLARLALGNPRATREAIDDMNRLPIIDVLARDLRSAFRALRRSPAFTATTLITLALVIGGNVAVGSLADAILLRPLPYPRPDQLATVVTDIRGPRGVGRQDSQDGAGWTALRDGATTVDVALSTARFGGGVNAVVDNIAVTVSQSRVSAGYFHVLGIAPAIGREFTRDEDRPGGPAVAVISHALWQRQLHADPAIVGKTMLLRGEAHTVIGVMPAAFQAPGDAVDVWTPARPSSTGEGGGSNYGVIARVRSGHTWTEANAELAGLGRASARARNRAPDGTDISWSLVSLQETLVSEIRMPIEILVGAMSVVLIIACVNIAAMLLARGRSRSREIATRMALGGGRGAVVRQLMVENVALAAIGGTLGALVGYVGLEGLKMIGGTASSQWARATVDARILGATAGLSLLTSLLFGLVPALQATRLDVNSALATGGSRNITGPARSWLRRGLVGTEVALGVVLLVVTGLLVRSFVNLRSIDPGFDPSNVTTATVSLQDARYDTAERVNRLFSVSLEALLRTPGVRSAAVSLELPYKRLLNDGFTFADDGGPGMANVMYVTPRFFETLRIPIHDGRDFGPVDRAGAPPVAIVDETFVRSWARGANPVGRRITMEGVEREIVGVVGSVTVAQTGIQFPGRMSGPLMASPLVFVPATQTTDRFLKIIHTWFQPVWTVRTDGPMNASLLPRAIHEADPMLPVQDVRSLSAVQAAATVDQRLLMALMGVLAGVALLLASVGIYGLIAHSVTERTREFGLRLALGATPAGAIRSVALSGVIVAAVGAGIGAGLAWIAVAVFDSFSLLFRVDKHDPATFAAVVLFLLAVTVGSSLLPALRILRLDPATILRE